MGVVEHADHLEHLRDARLRAGTRKAEADIGGDIEVGEERPLLRHDPDPSLLWRHERVREARTGPRDKAVAEVESVTTGVGALSITRRSYSLSS